MYWKNFSPLSSLSVLGDKTSITRLGYSMYVLLSVRSCSLHVTIKSGMKQLSSSFRVISTKAKQGFPFKCCPKYKRTQKRTEFHVARDFTERGSIWNALTPA